jgi:glycosyltransferase involved in cell wall biosynthesis
VRICHVTPALPPAQTARAQLPVRLGAWAAASGDEVRYVAPGPVAAPVGRAPSGPELPGPVTWLAVSHPEHGLFGTLRRGHLGTAWAALAGLVPAIRWADIVHVHGDGLLTELGALVAARVRRPVVLSAYGEEIWDYQSRRWRPDLFARAYRRAAHVVFYSHGLRNRSTEVGLGRRETTVVYPPVPRTFALHDAEAQVRVRAELGIRSRHLLVNIKALHPLSGQRYVLEALGEVIRTHPDTRLVIGGTGPLLEELKGVAKAFGVEGHVTFAGVLDQATVARYDSAADAFVLPSLVEAFPTSALEALACGTPVIAAESPGAMELAELFGFDVLLVPREHPMALAAAIVQLLEEKRRARWSTGELVEREFRAPAVVAQYRAVYERVLEEGPVRTGGRGQEEE